MDAERARPPRAARPARPRHRRRGLAGWILAALAAIALLGPLIANDRPIVARREGRITCPACVDLFTLGGGPDLTGDAAPGAGDPPAAAILGAPIPWSFRGIRLEEALQPPGRRHWLGTDALGRDLLARLIRGARVSLLVGAGATLLALMAGIAIGATAALRGGWVDLALVRLIDIFSCFPPFILALALVAAGGRGGIGPVIAGIALNRWASMARYVRGEVIRQRSAEAWEAARASGAAAPRLVVRHVLPLLAGPLVVLASFGVVHAIVLEAGLSFVGFGVDPPVPSWGAMLAESRLTLDAAWWPVAAPAAALLLTIASLGAAADRAATPAGARAPLI
jgi:peptide/nickel transport system permease protein